MKYLRFFIFFSLLASSCNVINKDEVPASFIHIDNVVLDPGIFGSAQNKISDVWVSANGQFIGVFTVPTIIPILSQGEVVINISAGVQDRGMAENRIEYPLTKHYVTTINIIPEETVIIEPVFSYFDELEFYYYEDFGGSSVAFEINHGGVNLIEDSTLNSSPLLDQTVGSLLPNFDEDLVEITSANPITSNALGPHMLEFNYKANQNFVVGLKSNTPGDPEDKSILMGLNTTYDESGVLQWKKAYVNLEEFMDLFVAQNRNQYGLYFASQTELDDPIIYLDNIKIISLEL